MKSVLKNKKIMVTGSCGTVGSELIRQLLSNDFYDPAEVVTDINDIEVIFLDQEWLNEPRPNFFADVRDSAELSLRMRGMDLCSILLL